MYVLRNHWYIKAAVILVFVIMYAVVIPGIYSMNICMMEGLRFREAYKKSARMVKKHPVGTISALVVYNLFILAIIGITYVLISEIYYKMYSCMCCNPTVVFSNYTYVLQVYRY